MNDNDPLIDLIDRLHHAHEIEYTDPEDDFLRRRAAAIRSDVRTGAIILLVAELQNIANAATRAIKGIERVLQATDRH